MTKLRDQLLADLASRQSRAAAIVAALQSDLDQAQADLAEIAILQSELTPMPVEASETPAHAQNAAPLPEPQPDAETAPDATQGAESTIPHATGPESDGAVFKRMRLDGEPGAWTNDDTGQTEAPAWPVGCLSDAICDGEAGDPAEVWTGRLDPEHKIGEV